MIIYAQLKYCSLLQEDFSSLSMLKLLTLSNVIYCVVVLYIAFVAKKVHLQFVIQLTLLLYCDAISCLVVSAGQSPEWNRHRR